MKILSGCKLNNIFGGIHTCWCYRVPMVPGLSMEVGLSMVSRGQLINLGETGNGKNCRKACCDRNLGYEYIYHLGDWNVVTPNSVREKC